MSGAAGKPTFPCCFPSHLPDFRAHMCTAFSSTLPAPPVVLTRVQSSLVKGPAGPLPLEVAGDRAQLFPGVYVEERLMAGPGLSPWLVAPFLFLEAAGLAPQRAPPFSTTQDLSERGGRESRPSCGGLHTPPYFFTLLSAAEEKNKRENKTKRSIFVGEESASLSVSSSSKITGQSALGTEGAGAG